MKRSARWWGWLLAVPIVLGLGRLRFDADVLNLLPGDLPVVRGLKLHQQHFANENELIITVDATQPEAAEEAARRIADRLRAATNLVSAVVWQPPWLDRPEDLAAFVAWLWLNQPPAAWHPLAARLAPENLEAHLDATRHQLATSLSPLEVARLGYDPLGLTLLAGLSEGSGFQETEADRFKSEDGRFRLVFVTPHLERGGFLDAAAWLREVQEIVERALATPDGPRDCQIAFTGKPAFLAEAANGMRRDMESSVLGTLAVIALMFFLAHRRWAPMLWLLALLQVVLLSTAALGGLLLGTINLVSLGFAAILLGLSVDYGLVLYQELAGATRPSLEEVRRRVRRPIWGSASTTALAFALLNFGGLPGLGQLGSLVSVGVLVAAMVMLHGFLPLVVRGLPKAQAASGRHLKPGADSPAPGPSEQEAPPARTGTRLGVWWATGALLLLGGLLLIARFPALDHSTQALSPRHGQAEPAMREIGRRFGREGEPILALVSGRDESEVRTRLELLQRQLRSALADGRVSQFELPLALWPYPVWQRTNAHLARALAAHDDAVQRQLLDAGFTAEAGMLATQVFKAWAAVDEGTGALWPADGSSRWLFDRVAAQTPEGWLALGWLQARADAGPSDFAVDVPGVSLCGWTMLGEDLLSRVGSHVGWLVTGMAAALALCLRITFRCWASVALALASLGAGIFLLLCTMAAAEWSWNLMNLMAIPLLLGAGVDYAIHVLSSLDRHQGDIAAMRRTTGRALALCAGTTSAAFGSLALSSNAGLASLGRVCAVGILLALCSALYLLPAWRGATHRGQPGPSLP